MSTCSYSAAPSACATPPSTWPRHCSGLITVPASAACTLLQDPDLAGRRVHRDPEALHVEGDRPRRARRCVALGRAQPTRRPPPARRRRPGRDQLGQRSRGAQRAPAPRRRCRSSRRRRCRARPRRCRTAARSIRPTCAPERRGGDLAVHGGGAVAELGGADAQLVAAAGVAARSGRARGARAAGTVSIIARSPRRVPRPASSGPGPAAGVAAAAARERRLAPGRGTGQRRSCRSHVVGLARRSTTSGVAGPDDVARAGTRPGRCPSVRASSSIADSTAKIDLATARSRGTRRPARCWCRPRSASTACSAQR